MNDTLTLRNDYLFKRLLGAEENKACLQDFLECVLDMPVGMIADLELLDKELSKDAISDKTGILDVKLRLKDGTTIDIEIQNSWSAEFIPRTLFYWSKMYIEGFKEGEPYTSLTRCIAINLISQGFKLNSEVHSAYSIQEQSTHKPLTDLLEIHFLNLSAVKGTEIRQTVSTKKQEKLLNWLRFIETDDKEERAMLAQENSMMTKASQVMDIFYLDEQERKRYEAAWEYESDRLSMISESERKGLERGLAEGEARGSRQAKLETAAAFKRFGFDIDKIAEGTGLSREEIEKL